MVHINRETRAEELRFAHYSYVAVHDQSYFFYPQLNNLNITPVHHKHQK